MQFLLLQAKSLKTKNVSCRPSRKIASKGLLLHLRTHATKHKEKLSVSDSIDGINSSIGENTSPPTGARSTHHRVTSCAPWLPTVHLAAEHSSRNCPPHLWTQNSSKEVTPGHCSCAALKRSLSCSAEPHKGTMDYPAGVSPVCHQSASTGEGLPVPFPRIQHHTIPNSMSFQTTTEEHHNLLFVT